MITAPVSPHDLDRALKRDSMPCNNDICYSPATCYGPIGNLAACCEPDEDCNVITTCYPYSEEGVLNGSPNGNAEYCDSEYPYCITYFFAAYSGLEVIYCDNTTVNSSIITATYNWGISTTAAQALAPITVTQYIVSSISLFPSETSTSSSTSTSTSTTSSPSTATPTPTPATAATTTTVATPHQVLPTSAVIGIAVGATLLGVALMIIAILLWRRHSSTTNMPPAPSNPEIQVASYASPSLSPNAQTSWVPETILGEKSEKSPSYGFEARRIGIQPDCQVEGAGAGAGERDSVPPAWAPPGDGVGNGKGVEVGVGVGVGRGVEPVVISELGGESRGVGDGVEGK
ncbi:hypothetical protein SBOR_1604 [Sclerotinia borealis F-4128]|uniref:Mid2 domain-containing protein n=1 Tax=Sclerotinia borealis (strain F-4128) TaxID=1432307 RepID=W9CQ77_SCLBF|nr:hypothetical protein SBOR_1604 [Sclerotinia borealis F-4128]